MMTDLIVVAGAPGSGKTTISERLQQKLDSPLIDFGVLREFHLDPEWKRANPQEEQMAFDNLVYILKNYGRHGYTNVIVNDLREHRIREIPTRFQGDDFVIITLVVTSDAVLRARVLDPTRDSGFRDVAAALAWNQSVIARPTLPHEYKIDNTAASPDETVAEILQILGRQI